MKMVRDDVRQRILDAAREEFLISGYAGASMRAIAAQAGMTVGNIYLYFAGKEQLFEAVVQEPVDQLREVTQMRTASDENMRQLVAVLHDVFIQNRVEFLILLTRSEGSKYGKFKETIVDIARHRLQEQFGDVEDEALCAPLAVAIIEGLADIYIRFDGDEEKLTGLLFRFLHYMLHGLFARLQTEDAK